MGFLKVQCLVGVSHEIGRGAQGDSCGATEGEKSQHAGPALASAGVAWLVLTFLLQVPRTQQTWDTDKGQEGALEGGRGPVLSKEAWVGSGEKRLL